MNPAVWLLKGFVKGYRYFISPWFSGSCRYQPTCSQYALDALSRHGAFYGSWLTLHRLARCHPWGGHGIDPVPNKRIKQHKPL